MRPLLVLILSIALLFAPTAIAQPSTQLTLTGGSDRPVNTTNTEYVVPLEARLRISNVVCSGGTATVRMTATADGLTAQELVFTAPEFTVNVPPGEYVSRPFAPEEPLRTTLLVRPNDVPPEGRTVRVEAKGALGSVSGCRGTQDVPPAEGTRTLEIQFGFHGPAPTTPAKKMPAASWLAPAALLALVAALRRR